MRMLVLVSVPLSPCRYNRRVRWQYQGSRETTTQYQDRLQYQDSRESTTQTLHEHQMRQKA